MKELEAIRDLIRWWRKEWPNVDYVQDCATGVEALLPALVQQIEAQRAAFERERKFVAERDAYVQEKVADERTKIAAKLHRVASGYAAGGHSHHTQMLHALAAEIVGAKVKPTGSGMSVTNSVPPVCQIHQEAMALCVYDRPGSSPGNGWVCQSCFDAARAAMPADPPKEKP